eukprot:13208044-Alexandrium_andersonii.AAC.1
MPERCLSDARAVPERGLSICEGLKVQVRVQRARVRAVISAKHAIGMVGVARPAIHMARPF